MDEKTEVHIPPNFREVSLVGRISTITLRSTFEEDNMRVLLDMANTTLLCYEDDNLTSQLKKGIKINEVEKYE